MTVEELEIIVTAKVEECLKEFKKVVPAVKQMVKSTQDNFQKMDTNVIKNKVNQAVQFIKNKLKSLKTSNNDNEIKISVNNKEASKQITQLEKEINSLQKKISAREMKLELINPQIDKIINDTRNEIVPNGISKDDPSMDKVVDNSLAKNANFKSLSKQAEKLYMDIELYNKQLDIAKSKMSQLKQEVSNTSTSQFILTSFFSTFKNKLEQTKSGAKGLKNTFNQLPKIAQNITNNVKNSGAGMKNGLKHVLKYATALFSIRGIYSVLSQSAQSWLSSQNSGAQRLSANIDYLKYAMGSVFAPVIQYVINLVYQLIRTVQSVVYAFSGINIFAKATASSMNRTAGSASKASKSLSGVHSEINNVSEKDNNNSGSGAVTPGMDLSQMDSQLSPIAQKLYNFFKPLKESWDKYGNSLIGQVKVTAKQVGGLISAVWRSFEKIITNGTVYSILENILIIIGNIAEAFANAWNNGNGDAIIQNLADAFNNILNIIDKIVQSSVFQWILDVGVSTIEKFTESIKFVTVKLSEFIGYFTGDNQKKLDGWAIIIGSIATAIGLVCSALAMYNVVTGVAAIVTSILTSPITLVILAIAALTAAIVSIIVYWDEISSALIKGWEWIKQKAEEIFNSIVAFFKNVWNDIKTTITNVINGIKSTISNILNTISTIWSNIWNKIKNTVSNVWNGIWSTIKNVINSILWGIENFVNGTIKGINKLLSGINKVANALGSLIGLNPISLQISTISLPRLAKGGVLTQPTAVLAGEYSGASSNPEIVTPQNILRETFEDVMSNYSNNNGRPLHVTIQYLGKTIFDDTIDYINSRTRRTGKNTIVMVGD